MIAVQENNQVNNTSHKVVLPFYLYAAAAFLVATILLFFSTKAFTQHYFHPHTLAITHVMALGWGTMIILGASHQLVPVLIESKLYSNVLANASFVFAGIGIPLLVHGFYLFQLGWPTILGGIFINVAIIAFLVNLTLSMIKSKNENVHAVFVFTAGLWLLLTTLLGLVLTLNFTMTFLPKGSLHYLSLHAHMGIVGWLLLLVIGVGSRLIPMFLISKYQHKKLLWIIYGLINTGLIIFLFIFLYAANEILNTIPVLLILAAVALFVGYCYQCYRNRIRKQVDPQMKISLLSVVMMLVPVAVLGVVIVLFFIGNKHTSVTLAYGFTIFFGWLTALIFGMTFKTLPFIIWNKVYHLQAGTGKTPSPKDLFSSSIFYTMTVFYLLGFGLFLGGIFTANLLILQVATVLLIGAAVLYNCNVFKLLIHQSGRPWK